nr:zinc-binding alcohol dehydrogenase family protein [uncultured Sphingomonas sp.]
MKAAIVERLGAAPLYGNFAEPDIAPGEVPVRVQAAALKQLERAIVAGKHYSSPSTLPIIPGLDGVGWLDDGTHVYFMAPRRPFGAMAERAAATLTVPIPDGLDPMHALTVVNPALAAWLPLTERASLRRGETVLILGATGAAGRMAVALSRHLGAGRVVACGRRDEVLSTLGADATINLGMSDADLEEAFGAEAGRGIDVIVDYVWGKPAELLIHQLARPDLHASDPDSKIRYVSVGAMAGPDIRLPSAALRGSRLELIGSGTGNFPAPDVMKNAIADVLDFAGQGMLPVDIATFPLSAIGEAWDAALPADTRTAIVMSEGETR